MLITLAMVAHLAPPAAFDHEPTRPYEVLRLDAAMAQAFCDREPGEKLMLGCSFEKSRTIYIRGGLAPEVEAIVLRHEKAHLNGWVHP